MATQAATQIDYNFGLLDFNGFPVEHWRIAAGAAPGDTATITPSRFTLVKGVIGPVTNNATTLGTTNVTVTIPTLNGSSGTVGQIDVLIIGFQGA